MDLGSGNCYGTPLSARMKTWFVAYTKTDESCVKQTYKQQQSFFDQGFSELPCEKARQTISTLSAKSFVQKQILTPKGNCREYQIRFHAILQQHSEEKNYKILFKAVNV